MNKRTKQIIVGNTPLLVDFAALQKRRNRLAVMAYEKVCGFAPHSPQGKKDFDTIGGVLSFLDAFADAAAEVLGEKAVFGKATK